MGWNSMHPIFSNITFANGEKLDIPTIEVGDGGHVYRPEGFPSSTNPKHTTFGRGYQARDDAKRIVTNKYVALLETAQRRGSVPTSVNLGTNSNARPGAWFRGPAFYVAQHHHLWGWMLLSAELGEQKHTVTYRSQHHVAAMGYAVKELYCRAENTMAETVKYDTHELAKNAMLRFKANPVKEAAVVLGSAIRDLYGADEAQGVLGEERDWVDEVDWEDTFRTHYIVKNAAQYLTPEALGELFRESAPSLEELGRAISVTGAKFETDWTYGGYYAKAGTSQLKSVRIMTPARPNDKGQAHHHQITFDDRGISVHCGYIEDEENAIDYQKRHIMDAIKEISAEPQWEEETYEIGKGE